MGTWAYVGSLLLMALPIAGFIIAIVWACGATSNPNRRNLARATLILIAIGIVLSILLSAAIVSIMNSVMQQLGGGSFNDFMYNFEGQMGAILPFIL
jgi:amino acid transporter